MFKQRKLALINVLILLALFCGNSLAFFEEDRISVKMSGMGNLYTDNDVAGTLFYPTMLPATKLGFELMHSQGYTPASGLDFGGFVKGFQRFGFGVGFNRLQEKDLDFSETTILVAAGIAITPSFSVGMGSKFLQLATPFQTEKTSALEPSFQVAKGQYIFRVKANNLFVGGSGLKDSIATYYDGTMLYHGNGFNIAVGYSGLEKFSIGYEQLLNENFHLRAGYESDGVVSLGTTISMGRWTVNYALLNDEVTGIQQRFSIGF